MLRGSIAALCALLLMVSSSAVAAEDTAWEIAPSPNAHATQHNFLNDIACVDQSDCWSVGYYRAATAYQPVMQHWDGGAWSLEAPPDSSTTRDDYVQGLACATSSQCWSVGFSWSRTASAYQTLIQRWDGSAWSDVAPESPGIASNTYLLDVTCQSTSQCWAVGYQQIGLLGGGFGPNQTLIKHWDGESWQTIASPNTLPTQGNMLTSVTCVEPSDCWAVGSYSAGSANQSLALPGTGPRGTSSSHPTPA